MPQRNNALYNFRGLVLAAMCVMALALVSIGYTIICLRADAIEDAYNDTGNVSSVLAQQVAQSVHLVESVLDDLKDQFILNNLMLPADFNRTMKSEYGHAILARRTDKTPMAEVITVLDADGELLATSRNWPPKPINLSARDYFRQVRMDRGTRIYISLPLDDIYSREPTVFFSKAVFGEAKAFLGVAVIAVPLSHFRHIYESVGALNSQVFTLARSDGTTLVRFPSAASKAGAIIPADSPWYEAVARGGGHFQTKRDGFFLEPRFVSMTLVPNYPLVVSVGVSEDAALATWRRRSLSIASGALVMLACCCLLFWAVRNRINMLRSSELSLAQKSQELALAHMHLDAAVSNIAQGVSMFDSEQRLVVFNHRYLEIYSLSPEVVKLGVTFEEILNHRKALGNYVADPRRYVAESTKQVLTGKSFKHTAMLTDGRVVAVKGSPTGDGGWVATHEDITEKYHADALISHMARHDALTGLPNRVTFDLRMAEATGNLKRDQKGFALLMIDLDQFKPVNDRWGHPAGDAVLKEVSQRLLACVGPQDTCARLGGDEFVILHVGQSDLEESARCLANALLDRIPSAIAWEDIQLRVGLSIGIALAPQHGFAGDVLLAKADAALYDAKAAGRNRLRFFKAGRPLSPGSLPQITSVWGATA